MSSLRLCFLCNKNPPGEDLGLCDSCLLEYPFCYECGENERNIPYKLCTKCYNQGDVPTGVPKPVKGGRVKVLERLDSKKAEYKRAYDLFKSSWVKNPPPPEPEAIYAVCNGKLFNLFQGHVKRLKEKGSDSTTSYNFHGTVLSCDLLSTNRLCSDQDCGICGISRIGFDKSLIGTNIARFKRYGEGFYLAPNSSKCHDYTQGVEEIGVRAQLLCSVASGTKYQTQKNHVSLVRPPGNCDSVHGVGGSASVLNYDEIVVFESEALLPEFVIVYRKDGTDQIAT